MTDLTQLFDSYSRQARLYPALLTLAPGLAVLLSIAPQLATRGVGPAILSIAVACGLLYLLADIARSRGKALEPSLLSDWGGWPTTLWLRHSTGYLTTSTRFRYHAVLEASIVGLSLPTPEEEELDVAAADERYGSAVEWLKAQCRGSAPLVDKENASYGFRRNMLGLRPIGILIAVAALAGELAVIFHQSNPSLRGFGVAASHATPWQLGAIAVSMVAIVLWIAVVRRRWTREAADAYARALLSCCDKLPR